MNKVHKNLYIGDEYDCFYENKPGWVVIHACKHPCHQRAVGYSGNLKPSHPCYLIKEAEHHLFLNMVDMTAPLSHKFTEPIIDTALKFIERNTQTKNVLIHCNKGLSRSPTLVLIYLAKRANTISNESYLKAKAEFVKLFPNYSPGLGIEKYLTRYWNQLE